MSVLVRIPQPIRRITNGLGTVELNAVNLMECLNELERKFPDVKGRVLDEQGQLRRFVNIYVNGEDVRFLQNLNTPLKPGDEVSIVPAIAGG